MVTRTALPKYVKAVTSSKMDDESKTRLDSLKVVLGGRGYWGYSAHWSHVADIVEKLYTAGVRSTLTTPHDFKYVNYVPMFLDDDQFVAALIDSVVTKTRPSYNYGRTVKQCDYLSLEAGYTNDVVRAIIRKYPASDPKTVKLFAELLEGSEANHEYRLFHLVALNEFLIDESGTDTTFGEYLEDVTRFNTIHEKMMKFDLTTGPKTADIFSLASSSSRWDRGEFVLWFQNLPSTKTMLMGMTANQYNKALSETELRTSVSGASKRLKLILSTPEKKNGREITHFDYEVAVIKALSGHRQGFNDVSMSSPTAVIGEVMVELATLYGRTSAVTKHGEPKKKHGVEASIVLDVFEFLAEHAGEFSLDEIVAIFITLITSNTVVRSGGAEDTFRLYQHAIRSGEPEQAVALFRLAAYIMAHCRGQRPTRTEWNDHLEDGSALGLDPSLAAGFVVEKGEPETGPVPNGKLRYWRMKFGEQD